MVGSSVLTEFQAIWSYGDPIHILFDDFPGTFLIYVFFIIFVSFSLNSIISKLCLFFSKISLINKFEYPSVEIATIISKNLSASDILNPNVVKAFINEREEIIEFKRNIFKELRGGV